jgi:hypothetical protein
MFGVVVTSAILAIGVIACSGSDVPTAPSTAAATSSPAATPEDAGAGMGTLAIQITDSPFSDAKALLVSFSDVSVHTADPGSWTTLPFASGTSRTCDLKKLNGPVDVLGVGPLAPGHYTQIRLTVSSANLYFDNPSTGPACAPQIAAPAGASAPVDIPSGEVKLNNEFTLTSAGTTIVLDFDGDQSIHETGGGNGNGKGNGNSHAGSKYMMSPVIRVVSVK